MVCSWSPVYHDVFSSLTRIIVYPSCYSLFSYPSFFEVPVRPQIPVRDHWVSLDTGLVPKNRTQCTCREFYRWG